MTAAPTVHSVVGDLMLRRPKVHSRALRVGEARAAFADDHVHMLLLVDQDLLLGTLVRDDISARAPLHEAALRYANLSGRTVPPTASAEAVRLAMNADGPRRLAVVDHAGRLLGLLCLKRHRGDFCGEADVAGRRSGRLSS